MFRKIKVINYFFLTVCLVVAYIWGFFGIFTYSILGASLLIYTALKGKGITKYIKEEYPQLYERKKMINRMTIEGDFAINFFALTKFEVNSFSNKKIVNYILGVRSFLRDIILSFCFIIIIATFKHFIKW